MSKCFSIFKHALMTAAVVLVLTSPAWATTYYVSTSGSDSNSGSSTSPYKTVSYAASRALSGDLVHVNAGTYTETSQINLVPGATLEGAGATTVIVAGFAANPLIQLTSSTQGTVGNQEVRSLKVDGNNTTGLSAVNVTRRSNVAVHDCTFVNFGQSGLTINGGADDFSEPTTYATGVAVYNNTFTNCSVLMGPSWVSGSVYIRGLQGARIYNNTMTENSRGSNSGGCVIFFNNGWFKDLKIYGNTMTTIENVDICHFAIELWKSHGVEIYNNTITGNVNLDTCDKGAYSYGLDFHNNLVKYDTQSTQDNKAICFDGNCSDITIRDNTMKNMQYPIMFYFRNGGITVSNIHIYYNLILGVGKTTGSGRALTMFSSDSSGVMTNLYVYNNVIDSLGLPMTKGIDLNVCGTYSNFYFRNNIITGASGYAIYIGANSTGVSLNTMYIQNNDFYSNGNNGVNNNLPATNLTNQNNLTTNALFVSSTDFHLQSTSPCIDSGFNTGLTQDCSGNPVPIGSGYDIGAYEYGSTAVTIAPPTNLQVL